MVEPNHIVSHVEANLELEKNGDEDKVETPLFKQIVCSLRYLCNNRMPLVSLLVY